MTPTELHTRIRAACLTLLAAVAMHPATIAHEVHATIGQVNEALRDDWQHFRQVAGRECFLWTVATNSIAITAQREVVAVYAPLVYAPMQHNDNRQVGQLTATSAIGRALLAIGSGTVEELAEAAGCESSTIQQQSARFSDYLTITKELVQGEKRRRWRITRIALKAPIGGAA